MLQSQTVEIVLEKGAHLKGKAFGDFSKSRYGEFVFSTAMSGIEESLTDPSFAKQIIVSTVAHVGNTGANLQDMESSKIWAEGLVCRHLCTKPSNWRTQKTLHEWIVDEGRFVIDQINTRQLTLLLREQGSQRGVVFREGILSPKNALEFVRSQVPPMDGQELASKVSCKASYTFGPLQSTDYWPTQETLTKAKLLWTNNERIAVWDFGAKNNILRILSSMGARLTVLPTQSTAEEILALNLDGLMLSNGPGDPSASTEVIAELKKLLGKIPIFGICLGHQLLAQALGAKTRRMPFGHRGIHHPVVEYNEAGKPVRTWITSQNHGFVVDESTLPTDVRVQFRHADDGSIEGISSRLRRCFSVQFHPESAPGPTDAIELFRNFQEIIRHAT